MATVDDLGTTSRPRTSGSSPSSTRSTPGNAGRRPRGLDRPSTWRRPLAGRTGGAAPGDRRRVCRVRLADESTDDDDEAEPRSRRAAWSSSAARGRPAGPPGTWSAARGSSGGRARTPTQEFEMSPEPSSRSTPGPSRRSRSGTRIRTPPGRSTGPSGRWSRSSWRDGKTLLGVAAFPRWLEQKLGAAERLVSATFDRADAADAVARPGPEPGDRRRRVAGRLRRASPRGDTVRRDIVLHKIGDASWDGSTVTASELARAAGRIRVPRALAYPAGVTLERVRLSAGGRGAGGHAEPAAGRRRRAARARLVPRVSFDRATRDVLEVSLVPQTRPADAITATFARNREDRHGTRPTPSSRGAVCASTSARRTRSARDADHPRRPASADLRDGQESDADFARAGRRDALRRRIGRRGGRRVLGAATAPAAPPRRAPS